MSPILSYITEKVNGAFILRIMFFYFQFLPGAGTSRSITSESSSEAAIARPRKSGI